jgi:hypothetical protein
MERRPSPPAVAYARAMYRALDELFCPDCTSYAHPFLEACPVCGSGRASCYEAAAAAPDQGYASLVADSRTAIDVEQVVLRYTLKSRGATVTTSLHVGLTSIAAAVDYRVRIGGDPGGGSEHAFLEVAETDLAIRDRTAPRERARVPLEAILALGVAVRGRRADAWTGLAFDGRREQPAPAPLDGELVLAHATPDGLRRVSLANRVGLLSPKARPDHYAILARWLGVAAAAAAERRWTKVGPRLYAHELGLAPAPPETAPADAPSPASSTGSSSVADALRLLEQLRAEGLVTDGEYQAKRREILDRI